MILASIKPPRLNSYVKITEEKYDPFTGPDKLGNGRLDRCMEYDNQSFDPRKKIKQSPSDSQISISLPSSPSLPTFSNINNTTTRDISHINSLTFQNQHQKNRNNLSVFLRRSMTESDLQNLPTLRENFGNGRHDHTKYENQSFDPLKKKNNGYNGGNISSSKSEPILHSMSTKDPKNQLKKFRSNSNGNNSIDSFHHRRSTSVQITRFAAELLTAVKENFGSNNNNQDYPSDSFKKKAISKNQEIRENIKVEGGVVVSMNIDTDFVWIHHHSHQRSMSTLQYEDFGNGRMDRTEFENQMYDPTKKRNTFSGLSNNEKFQEEYDKLFFQNERLHNEVEE